MTTGTKHAVENFSNEMSLEGKNITIIIRSEESHIIDRPNALILTRGAKGWTSCKQLSWYHVQSLAFNEETGKHDLEVVHVRDNNGNDERLPFKEYSDAEILDILEEIKTRGVKLYHGFGKRKTYIVNE